VQGTICASGRFMQQSRSSRSSFPVLTVVPVRIGPTVRARSGILAARSRSAPVTNMTPSRPLGSGKPPQPLRRNMPDAPGLRGRCPMAFGPVAYAARAILAWPGLMSSMS
jgi:hypothetical protein